MAKISTKIKDDLEDIKAVLDSEKAILKRISDAKIKAEKYLSEGYDIPGYVLENTYGNRKWSAGTDIDSLFSTFKRWLPKKTLYTKTELLSPAQLEKFFIEDTAAVEKLKDFFEREYKGKKLKRI